MDRDIASLRERIHSTDSIPLPRRIQFHFHNANRLENVSSVVATRLIRAIKQRRPEFAGEKKNKCRASTPQLWFGKTCLLLDDGHGDPKREKNPLTSTTGRRFVSSQLETPCAHSTASKRLQRTFTFCCLYIRLVEFVKFWNSKFGFFEFLNFSICEIWNKKFGFLDFLDFWNFWILEFVKFVKFKIWIFEIFEFLNSWICEFCEIQNLDF